MTRLVYSQDSGLLTSTFAHIHVEKTRKEELYIICFLEASWDSTLEKCWRALHGSWPHCYTIPGILFDKVGVKMSVILLFMLQFML